MILTFQKDDIQEGKLRPDFYLERKIGEETFKLVLDAKFKPSQNLHPCEVAKYVDPWEKEGEEKGLGDNCLAVTLEDGERISYDIVTFGFKKEREGIEHEYISDISERNKMVLGKVLDRFFLLERRGHHRNKGCLGYVPLEIPKV
ncbi:TPA: hypothetical protein EYP13_02940 [Candidatus Micrarchaeota archaeon]|nr:hypothetical protein [Candidatus Micrarchaeota archaeon]